MPTGMLLANLRTFVIARVLIATILLCLGLWVFPEFRGLFSILVVFLCLVSLVYILWFLSRKNIQWLIYFQILVDFLWETVLVHFTGGVDSIFVVFYLITIFGSSLVLEPRQGLWPVIGCCLIFTGVVLFEFGSYYPWDQWEVVFYGLLVRLTIFAMAGILGIYFSKRIHHLEKKLKDQEQLTSLGEMTAKIAHEIKNPLAAISGSAEVLYKELNNELSEDSKDLLENIVKETKRLKRILTSILDYSRADLLKRSHFDLVQAVEEVLAILENSSPTNGEVQVIKRFAKRPLRFYGDLGRVKQMLFNLLLNAYEAMPEGGRLTIDLQPVKDQWILISVRDSGHGMTPEVLKQSFQPFYSTKEGGTGLGLAIIEKIVEHHGGKIEVKSQVGEGTRFDVLMPFSGR